MACDVDASSRPIAAFCLSTSALPFENSHDAMMAALVSSNRSLPTDLVCECEQGSCCKFSRLCLNRLKDRRPAERPIQSQIGCLKDWWPSNEITKDGANSEQVHGSGVETMNNSSTQHQRVHAIVEALARELGTPLSRARATNSNDKKRKSLKNVTLGGLSIHKNSLLSLWCSIWRREEKDEETMQRAQVGEEAESERGRE